MPSAPFIAAAAAAAVVVVVLSSAASKYSRYFPPKTGRVVSVRAGLRRVLQ